MQWVRNAVKLQIIKFIWDLATLESCMCRKIHSGKIYGQIAF
jgi:hypothetical protein